MALDLGIGAVMPILAGEAVLDVEMRTARDQSVEPLQRMITAAHTEGTLRADVALSDTGLLLIRLNRPLPGAFPRALDQTTVYRQLDLALVGLRTDAAPPVPLSGSALSLADLRAISSG